MSYHNHALRAENDYEKMVIDATTRSLMEKGRIKVRPGFSIDVSDAHWAFTEDGNAFLVHEDGAVLIGEPHIQFYNKLAESLKAYRNGSGNKGLEIQLVDEKRILIR